jgi:hypothetical protein
METETSASSCYPCPHCRALIGIGPERWRGWVLCPECGRAGLPPEAAVRYPAFGHRVEGSSPTHLTGSPNSQNSAVSPAPVPVPSATLAPRPAPSNASRVIASTGLIVSLFLLLVAYLDRSSQSSAIFGFLTVVFFLLLLRLPRRR